MSSGVGILKFNYICVCVYICMWSFLAQGMQYAMPETVRRVTTCSSVFPTEN